MIWFLWALRGNACIKLSRLNSKNTENIDQTNQCSDQLSAVFKVVNKLVNKVVHFPNSLHNAQNLFLSIEFNLNVIYIYFFT